MTINVKPMPTLRYDMATPGPRIIPLSKALIGSAGGKLSIQFKIASPVSPLELGVSQDPRKLGLSLQSLEVISAH